MPRLLLPAAVVLLATLSVLFGLSLRYNAFWNVTRLPFVSADPGQSTILYCQSVRGYLHLAVYRIDRKVAPPFTPSCDLVSDEDENFSYGHQAAEFGYLPALLHVNSHALNASVLERFSSEFT